MKKTLPDKQTKLNYKSAAAAVGAEKCQETKKGKQISGRVQKRIKDKIIICYSVAFEEAGPTEIGTNENAFDLANEGIRVTPAELQAAKNSQLHNVKINMDS